MSILFATGLNGYLLREYCSHKLRKNVDSKQMIRGIKKETKIPSGSTLLLAGWPTRSHYDSSDHLDFLEETFKPFLKKVSEAENVRVIVFGTCLEYGKEYYRCVETAAIHPSCALGKSKALAYDYASKLGLSCYHLRIFYPYNFDNPRIGSILWHLEEHLKNNGNESFKCSRGLQQRDFFHTSILSETLDKIINSSWNGQQNLLNVCSGVPTTVRDIMFRYLQSRKMTTRFDFGAYPVPEYEPEDFYGSSERLDLLLTNSGMCDAK